MAWSQDGKTEHGKVTNNSYRPTYGYIDYIGLCFCYLNNSGYYVHYCVIVLW